MKTTSRKKLLISSVAMLLVAMLALGTATFAWFTSSTSVQATGITVRTSKTSQLEIADDKMEEYSPSGFAYTGMSAIMVPTSSADGQHWFYTNAADKDAFTADDVNSFSAVPDATKSKYVYVNQLNIKNGGDQPISDIKITISNMSGDYLRVALVPVNSKTVGGDKTMTADAFKSNIYGNTTSAAPSNLTYNPVESTSKISENAITPSTSKVITVKEANEQLASGEEVHYNLFVWFEGQDAKCFDGKAGQGVENLSFAVTGTPVSETN